jgi:hypothetical protein
MKHADAQRAPCSTMVEIFTYRMMAASFTPFEQEAARRVKTYPRHQSNGTVF